MGLSNPGAENFAEMIRPNENVPIIVSLVGSVEEDFEFMIKKLNHIHLMISNMRKIFQKMG